jgi:hypothetical protein
MNGSVRRARKDFVSMRAELNPERDRRKEPRKRESSKQAHLALSAYESTIFSALSHFYDGEVLLNLFLD